MADPTTKAIEGRSLGRIAWTRLKRDKVALTGGAVVLFLIVVAVLAYPIAAIFGHPIDEMHGDLIDPNLGGLPKGEWGGMSWDYLLGVEPGHGRDVFSRVVVGAQVSLLIAFVATVVSTVLGVTLGLLAGYKGGWIDTVLSRVMDYFLAFPTLLLSIALIVVMPRKFLGLSGTWLNMAVIVLIIGGFSWPYIGRIVRGQVLSLKEREFVEASKSLGARTPYIVFRELLPNLVAPILVYATLAIPTNMLFEAALSFLGVGVQPPKPSWGQMISDAINYYEFDPLYLIVPGGALFITVLAFNLFGDGLRDALDPKAN
ncbi:ABC-type dipeptide/oligopeptide/nickel transport system permease subunit [Allocatelliglobosispora scoriae]|uniref:ABC-type dipeptide/oligopeptide/nickel transport system permease subunit n=1 Tax=Allocatelliglobosispora scoriae TaxID=643052 RepID=A0A841BVK4_9ACTN|nr:ABC transporter permease [Allocatelliglobosispora scoriae]MBB5871189.1 ABC-type dipeptide/oligopeptide/nickel transport system permease subunit [Allocatelliglobosispora scoriae]